MSVVDLAVRQCLLEPLNTSLCDFGLTQVQLMQFAQVLETI